MKEIYNKVLDAVAIDTRLDTGIFDVLNNDHLSIFRELLVKEGVSEDIAITASNKLAEAGRFPERQCYNKDGLLVTFPSPEHKQRAIARGTHFEKNPKAALVNIFGAEPEPQQGQAQAPVTAQPNQQQGVAPQPQQAPQPQTIVNPPKDNPAQPKVQIPIQPQSNALAATATEPNKPNEPVNADNRTPEDREADANAVEKMLKAENKSYTLAEAIAFGFYSKNNIWYTSEGEKVGRLWYVANRKQQIILPC